MAGVQYHPYDGHYIRDQHMIQESQLVEAAATYVYIDLQRGLLLVLAGRTQQVRDPSIPTISILL